MDHKDKTVNSEYLTKKLSPGKLYYWRVRACSMRTCGAWGSPWSFQISSKARADQNPQDGAYEVATAGVADAGTWVEQIWNWLLGSGAVQ